MADSYSVKARLSAVDSGFTSTLRNAIGATDSLASRLKSGFSFGILTGAGQKAFSMLTGSVSGLISEINSSSIAWKNFESNMSIVGKSADEIAKIKKELQTYAEQTIYSASDMASTYAQLAAVGTKNTTELVKGFGGLAAAAENPKQAMKTLSQQGTQMAARPTVAWQDFKLMLEQTPAGMAAVAKQMGMTSAEMVTAIQAGEISTQDFFAAISAVGNSDAFANMATTAKSMGQSMDSMKESLSNKLQPAFEALSQVGIKVLDNIGNKINKINADALAAKVKAAVNTVNQFLNVLKTSFSGVGKAFGSAFSAIGKALSKNNAGFSKTTALQKFKSVCEAVAGALTKFAGFLEKHADTIAKVLPYAAKLAAAFVAYKILNSIAPGVTAFAKGLVSMAGKGIATLAAKLFGIAGGQKAVGTASASSSPSIWQSALAILSLGAAVLLACAGLALLAQTAIALVSAGAPAIIMMLGLVGLLLSFPQVSLLPVAVMQP